MTSKPEVLLWLNESRGVFIPRDFAQSFADRAKSVSGVTDSQWEILEAGPEHEFYWDVWAEVELDAVVTDENGVKYTIWQSGDCWLVPEGMVWDDDEECYKWPEEVE